MLVLRVFPGLNVLFTASQEVRFEAFHSCQQTVCSGRHQQTLLFEITLLLGSRDYLHISQFSQCYWDGNRSSLPSVISDLSFLLPFLILVSDLQFLSSNVPFLGRQSILISLISHLTHHSPISPGFPLGILLGILLGLPLGIPLGLTLGLGF